MKTKRASAHVDICHRYGSFNAPGDSISVKEKTSRGFCGFFGWSLLSKWNCFFCQNLNVFVVLFWVFDSKNVISSKVSCGKVLFYLPQLSYLMSFCSSLMTTTDGPLLKMFNICPYSRCFSVSNVLIHRYWFQKNSFPCELALATKASQTRAYYFSRID